jgi:hypothetical protein
MLIVSEMAEVMADFLQQASSLLKSAGILDLSAVHILGAALGAYALLVRHRMGISITIGRIEGVSATSVLTGGARRYYCIR